MKKWYSRAQKGRYTHRCQKGKMKRARGTGTQYRVQFWSTTLIWPTDAYLDKILKECLSAQEQEGGNVSRL